MACTRTHATKATISLVFAYIVQQSAANHVTGCRSTGRAPQAGQMPGQYSHRIIKFRALPIKFEDWEDASSIAKSIAKAKLSFAVRLARHRVLYAVPHAL